MSSPPQRTVFSLSFMVLATLFGTAVAAWRLNLQDDLIYDLIKIGGLIAFASLTLAYTFWSGLCDQPARPIQGGFAGLVCGVLIVPLPFFAAGFKEGFFALYDSGSATISASFFGGLIHAINTGMYTYIEMTRASLAAVLGSFILGYSVARFYRPSA